MLSVRVGYGDCTPDHGFTLFMLGDFHDTDRVHARRLPLREAFEAAGAPAS